MGEQAHPVDWPLQATHFCRRIDRMVMVSTTCLVPPGEDEDGWAWDHGYNGVPRRTYETIIWSLHDDGQKDRILALIPHYDAESALRAYPRIIHRARANVHTPEFRRRLRKQTKRRAKFTAAQPGGKS